MFNMFSRESSAKFSNVHPRCSKKKDFEVCKSLQKFAMFEVRVE